VKSLYFSFFTEASKQVYRPPGLRGTASVKLHEFEPAENMKKEEASGMSKSAQRRKKKKDAKERAKQEAIAEVVTPALCSPPQTTEVTSSSQPIDKQKKLKNLRKKLRQIQDLKEQQASGKTLEKGQIDKISGEASLIQEIQQLELSS